MTPNDQRTTFTPDQLAEGLTDLARAGRPDYRDDLFRQTGRTRQRPAWTLIERWLPMTLVNARHSAAPPLRAVWILLLVGLVAAALAASLAIAGSQLLRDPGPRLSALAPVLVEGDPVDAPLSVPMGIDVGPDGNVYVVNSGTNELLVLDPTGREVRRWGGPGSGEGQFLFQRDPADPLNSGGGVAVAADGSVYVADMVNDRVQRFTPEGRFVRAWGGYGGQDGRFLEPFDIAVGPDGSVFVADDVRDDIQRFDPDGEWLETIGRHGSADGEMDSSAGISVDEVGTILNADSGNQRVQAWDETGSFLWSQGGVLNPMDVVADGDGNVYVADAESGVKLFDGSGEPVSVSRPAGWQVGYVGMSDDGTVYVSNAAADRIERLTIEHVEVGAAVQSPAPARASPEASVAPSSDQGSTASSQPAPGGPRTVRVGSAFPLPFTVELPSSTRDRSTGQPGWWLQQDEPGFASFQYVRDQIDPAYVTAYLAAGAFRDPCHPEDGMLTTSPHPTVDELVEALTHQTGVRAGPVTDIRFGAVEGKTFELDNNIDMTDCTDAPWLRQWTYRAGLDSDALAESEGLAGSHQRIAVVDVDGTPVLIEAWHIGALRDEVLEADALFESIRFE